MILVTGGTGVLGSHLLFHLAQKEEKIRATFRTERKLEVLKNIFSFYTDNVDEVFNKIEFVKCDITNIPELTSCFEDVTKVYHNAALVSFDPNDYFTLRKINIEGTANIVNLCIANEVKKLCHVSSVAAVGRPIDGGIITESAKWNKEEDHSVYAITKFGAEMEVWRGTQEGLNTVIVNPGIIIGPGDWRSSSSSLIRQIFKGMKYYTSGISGYVDVNDVAEIMIRLTESSIKNERYILVSENLSFKDFAFNTAEKLNVEPPKKEASQLLLNIAWRMDWLRHKLRGKRRRLPKQVAKTLKTDRIFSNKKIKNALDLEFKSIDDSLNWTCQCFLKEQT